MTGRSGRRSPISGSEVLHRYLIQLPGFLGQFSKDVPPSYLRKNGLRCTCGETVEFDPGSVLFPCPGCDRTFLRTQTKGAGEGEPATGRETRVRVARLQPAEPAPPCECENGRLLYEGRDGAAYCSNCDGAVGVVVPVAA